MKLTLFYEHVTVIDYAFLHEHNGIMGNSLIVDVEFVGETDEEGVIYDFSYAKNKVKEIIDRDCDHRLVIPKGSAIYENDKAYLKYSYGSENEFVEYWCPTEGLCEIPSTYIRNESLKAYLENIVMKEMPENITAVRLKLREEGPSEHEVFFHYTHGLKDHYGNCQRLFHGHKNPVKVEINGIRDIEKEKYLADKLFSGNIHFCNWENVINKSEIERVTGTENPEGRYAGMPKVHIRYNSSQGEFEGKVCGREIYFLQDETTVENLSIHFCRIIKKEVDQNHQVTVTAYEGIAKGAITTL
jgi:6-pyruvoyl-tetrahydropterin synthase